MYVVLSHLFCWEGSQIYSDFQCFWGVSEKLKIFWYEDVVIFFVGSGLDLGVIYMHFRIRYRMGIRVYFWGCAKFSNIFFGMLDIPNSSCLVQAYVSRKMRVPLPHPLGICTSGNVLKNQKESEYDQECNNHRPDQPTSSLGRHTKR